MESSLENHKHKSGYKKMAKRKINVKKHPRRLPTGETTSVKRHSREIEKVMISKSEKQKIKKGKSISLEKDSPDLGNITKGELDDSINDFYKQHNGDVCQIGIELAKKYSKDEDEYALIWAITQSQLFVENMIIETYSPLDKKEFINNVSDVLIYLYDNPEEYNKILNEIKKTGSYDSEKDAKMLLMKTREGETLKQLRRQKAILEKEQKELWDNQDSYSKSIHHVEFMKKNRNFIAEIQKLKWDIEDLEGE